MGSVKHFVQETFSVVHDFVQEAESLDILKNISIQYQIKEDCHHLSPSSYYAIVEQFIIKLKDVLECLRQDIEQTNSAIPQGLLASGRLSDNESCVESPEITRDGEEHLQGEKTSSLTIETLIAETDAQDIILPSDIGAGSKTTVLTPSFANTFVTAPEQQPHMDGVEDSTTILTATLGVEQSLFKKGHVEQEQILKCAKCGGDFSLGQEVNYYRLSNHSIPSTCSQCCSIAETVSKRHQLAELQGSSRTPKSSAVEGKNSENSAKKHICDKCGRVFSKWKHLSIHYTKVHHDEDGPESSVTDVGSNELLSNNTLPLYCCKTCNLACQSLQRFNTHTCRLPTDDENNASTLSNRILITNVLKLHKLRKFVCEICGIEYRTFKRITYHLPRCSPGPYPCNVCTMLFTSRRELNYHKNKMHKNEKCFVCEECGKSFQRKSSLQKHAINWHESSSAVGPFKCELCPKKFIRRIYLTNHKLRMHGLDKKFLCQICGNKFMTQNSLMAHMEVHNDIKRFECSFCKKKFMRKEKLKFHERIHTGERPFQCQVCVRGFVSKTKLDEHMSRHRGDRRYRCSYCSKTYAGAWDLKLHVKKIHDKFCDKVAVTVVTNNHTSTSNTNLSQVTQVLDPLAIATAASGLKEEKGTAGVNNLTLASAQGAVTSTTLEEVGGGMVSTPQYITVNGQQTVTIPVMGSMQGHIPSIGHVVQVSGSTVPLTGVGTALSGGASVQTMQAVQAVQTIPGVTAAEYSVQPIPQAVHTAQGYIFTQGFDMVSGTVQY
ncbi:zinc finger protein 728-like isoform X1 [Macrobrachium rosenbergii]|uniref:zinc finger protein 728-like isoform X1 n=1 Tax=Macrobrachium rosenbergii TaxID=79674 RepID=UPI0034D78BDE